MTHLEPNFTAISSHSFKNSEESMANIKYSNDSSKIQNNNVTKIIVIITIVSLTLMIVVMIPLLVFFLKSKNTNGDSITSVEAGTTRTPLATVTVYDVGNGGISGEPPCSSYTVLDEPLRNAGAPGTGGTCDQGPLFNTSIGGRWIRFMGRGGTALAAAAPGASHCGGFLAGWFNGSFPSTAGSSKTAKMCFQSLTIDCINMVTVSIVNCGSFYVNFLPPVLVCNSRYCTA